MLQQFESDYPSFYDKHIKKVLDNKSDKLSLKFETPKGFESEGKNSSAEVGTIVTDIVQIAF